MPWKALPGLFAAGKDTIKHSLLNFVTPLMPKWRFLSIETRL